MTETALLPVRPEPESESAKQDEESRAQLIHSLAHFYLTLSSKSHVPECTAQGVYDQYALLMTLTADLLARDLKGKLKDMPSFIEITSSIDSVIQEKILDVYGRKGPLNTIYKRRQFLESNFNFVRPVAIRLGKNKFNKEIHFHYVPLLQSLEALLSDQTVYKQYLENKERVSKNDSYTDIHDGTHLRNHPLFSKDSSSIQLILFQDEFAVANPLGSSKSELKMLGVYYTLGNLHPWNRSKVDPIPLVLICQSILLKYFSADKVFGPLVSDIAKLRDAGIIVNGCNIKGAVAYIDGDNLGHHYLGGFVENFSKSNFFCQYCTISRKELDEGRRHAEFRNKENYGCDVENVRAERERRGDSGWAG